MFSYSMYHIDDVQPHFKRKRHPMRCRKSQKFLQKRARSAGMAEKLPIKRFYYRVTALSLNLVRSTMMAIESGPAIDRSWNMWVEGTHLQLKLQVFLIIFISLWVLPNSLMGYHLFCTCTMPTLQKSTEQCCAELQQRDRLFDRETHRWFALNINKIIMRSAYPYLFFFFREHVLTCISVDHRGHLSRGLGWRACSLPVLWICVVRCTFIKPKTNSCSIITEPFQVLQAMSKNSGRKESKSYPNYLVQNGYNFDSVKYAIVSVSRPRLNESMNFGNKY